MVRTIADQCRRCDGKFGVDADPRVKDGQEKLQRRVPGSAVCKPCYFFVRGDEEYSKLSDSALLEKLNDPGERASYKQRREDWCADRRAGKRVRKGASNSHNFRRTYMSHV